MSKQETTVLYNAAKTREQIADEYGISTKTLKKWLQNAGIEIPRGLICPLNQRKIYKRLGVPKQDETGQIIPKQGELFLFYSP